MRFRFTSFCILRCLRRLAASVALAATAHAWTQLTMRRLECWFYAAFWSSLRLLRRPRKPRMEMPMRPVPRSASRLGSLIEVCLVRKNDRDLCAWVIAASSKTLDVDFAAGCEPETEFRSRVKVCACANCAGRTECAKADVPITK